MDAAFPAQTDALRFKTAAAYNHRLVSSDSTRWTVIRRAAAGSAPDRAEFARRYGPVIRAYLGARWRQTPLFPEVDDAAQQVFVECFKENGVLGRVDAQRETGFRAYL